MDRDTEQIHAVSDRKSLGIMLVGFGLLCFVNMACFFPNVLMPSVGHAQYQAFNIASTLAGVVAAACYGVIVLRGSRSALMAVSGIGHVVLVAGVLMAALAAYSDDIGWAVATGAAVGVGLALTMLYWFGMLTLVSTSRVTYLQGLLVLGGELIFIGVFMVAGAALHALAFAAIAASAGCAVAFHRLRVHAGWALPAPSDLRGILGSAGGWKSLSDVIAAPFVGLAIISFLYGGITAVVMGPEGSSIGATISIGGAPVGVVVFLVWSRLSKTKDFSLAMKVFFFVLVFAVAVLPFDMVMLGMSAGYQICALLLFSYIIISFGRQGYRLVALLLTVGYVVMRLFFLTGLYLPTVFSVSSYQSFISSTSLLLFLAYLLFAGILFFTSRERRRERAEKERILAQRDREQRELAQSREQMELARSYGREVEWLHQEVCEAIGRDFGLTRREIDVMALLAKGRDLGHISSELYLARNTVKGYMKKVYAKLDVHTKQELIDIVEDAKTGRAGEDGEGEGEGSSRP